MFKKKINYFIFLIFILVILLILSFNYSSALKTELDINKVLETEDYNYLSDVVKDYIRHYYKDTGEILLTEKNKKENYRYLNPEYIQYLNDINNDMISTEELKNIYEVVPNETVVDYIYMNLFETLSEEYVPSSFDLRNVNGKSFVTPIKDQKSTGLCWAFATNAQAESYLLVKNNSSFETGVSQVFSELQMDYATASNGVIDSFSKYSFSRILGEGGNFDYVTTVAMDNLGLVDIGWRNFDDYDYKRIEKNKIYKFKNSNYEVISTVDYPKLDLNNVKDDTIRNSYLNNLKKLIMNNGGAYVATVDPVSRCSISVNGNKLLYDDDKCASASHAMQIIGWDDNFEYSFCSGEKDDKGYYYLDSTSNCDNGTLVKGKGAWLLKNSWGSRLPYVYLAYDSMNTTINMITGMGLKNWDNNYTAKKEKNIVESIYKINVNTLEKLNKIKFNTSEQYVDYDVCVGTSIDKLNNCKEVTSTFPGIYTVDFLEFDIATNSNFIVNISASSGNKLISNINVYTDTIDKTPQIITDDTFYEVSLTNIDKYIFRLSSKTVNIPEDSIINYKVLDSENNEISSNYSYSENFVFANEVFSKLEIEKDLEFGTYKIQTIFDDKVLYESKLIVDKEIVTIEGSGTEDDPYIINTPQQLNLIRLDRFAYYKLGQDIDLTYDTQNENGLFYNDGLGWEPIRYSEPTKNSSQYLYFSKAFSGGFDGANHKIIGLYINRPNEDGVGLFSGVYNENYSNLYIKNVILSDLNIVGRDWVGGLLGVAFGTTYERILNISNVQIIGGSIKGNNYVGGVIGLVNAGSYLNIYGTDVNRHIISNLYNSATVSANDYSGGIFGMVTNINSYGANRSPINVFNLLNKGMIISDNNAGGIIGYIVTRVTNDISISNSINTGVVVGKSCSSAIVCGISDKLDGNIYLKNIYFLNELNIDGNNDNIILSNVSKKSISEMKDYDNYKEWDAFNDNWKLEKIDNIVRLPILNIMDFDYTSIDDIVLMKGEEVNIYDLIKPSNGVKNITYTLSDSSIVKIDENGLIKGLLPGNTTIHIVSYYDGYEGDIKISVSDKKYTITFDSNGGTFVEPIIGYVGESIVKPNDPIKDNYLFAGWYLDDDFKSRYLFDIIPGEDIIIYAKWINLDFSVKVYEKEKDKINNILSNTTFNNYIKNFIYDSSFRVDYYNYDNVIDNDLDAIVGTGSKVKFYYDTLLIKEFINIVRADITGDGIVNLADLSKLFNYYRGNINIDDIYLIAADVTGDKEVNLADLSKLFNYYRGNIKDI